MTVTSTTSLSGPYSGDGATDTFDYQFKIFAETDLEVTQQDTAGALTVLTLTTDYTVTGVAVAAGGTVVLTSALTTDYKLSIRRKMSFLQATDYRNQGGMYPESIETAVDKETMYAQQTGEEVARAPKFPTTDAATNMADLPTATVRANKAAGYDANGKPTVSTKDLSALETGAAAADASATAAATSAANAATSETNAATSETNAATSETNAAASATQAADLVDSVGMSDVVFVSSGPVSVADADAGKFYAVDTSAGDVTFNLAQISSLTLPFTMRIKKTTNDGNKVTVNRSGTDTIAGATSYDIAAHNSGAAFVADTDPAPDEWTPVVFGASMGDFTIDVFSGDGATTDFVLTTDPGSENNTDVYISGVYQAKSAYSVTGTTLSFTSAPASGTDNIEVKVGLALGIASPAANSVGTTQLQDGAVTTGKLGTGAVTLAKMADMATASLIGRDTAATGVPEVLSATTARALIGGNAAGVRTVSTSAASGGADGDIWYQY